MVKTVIERLETHNDAEGTLGTQGDGVRNIIGTVTAQDRYLHCSASERF